MKAYALLGGPRQLWPKNIKEILTAAQKNGDLIIGVDRGSFLLEELNIIPDLAIGDFDSLKPSELAKIEVTVKDIRYSNPIKDLTDSELMIQTAFKDYHVADLTLLGATGGRIDHFLVNLFMILNPDIRKFADQITLIDCQNKIKFFGAGEYKVQKEEGYPYFGVASLEEVKNLNILGSRYLLEKFSSLYPRIFSSNEFLPNTHSFDLKLDSGLVAVIFSKDIDRFYNI
ncbi:thiamine diphosphokinase [Lactobacillus hamsteri]|uniref:Thiamine diphosphokinase n=1 Tax=Lactobacillus hamsteri DSM 5661 = JCM 6256 TaxID=1423754 RepID=A0A0R1YPU3_9LACO|nr:thiamine diphosphokinase [Lactobacillus hamsteri]KRM41267.1 PTS family maltose glucose porter, IIABC component [Lactobacillus hamsteri DSM 5661 = JCM 6256]